MKRDAERRVAELRQQIKHADYQYYVLDNPELPDGDYDKLMVELRALERSEAVNRAGLAENDMWGAYGEKPTDEKLAAYDPSAAPRKQFGNPVHCVKLAQDGLVYVCDRVNDRIQVFTRQGKFVKEFLVHRETRGNGSVWTLSFSHDPQQKYLLIGDGVNQRAWILRRLV